MIILGRREGAGRPRKQPTVQLRIPTDIVDIVKWLRAEPAQVSNVRRLMAK